MVIETRYAVTRVDIPFTLPRLANNIHPGCVRGMRGLAAIMASWDAQAGIAEAAATNSPMLMAFLDYHNFFDSFEPRFFGFFLLDAGIHPDFVQLFVHLNTNAVRHIKIANTYGESIKPFNALGQGDPWVLLVAIDIVFATLMFGRC